MGTVTAKIMCPGGTHEDNTPSCAVYDDGNGFCFSCNTFFKGLQAATASAPKKESENLAEKLTYIDSLPLISHRGLEFRHDVEGYYIVWPSRDYYKHRKWVPRGNEPKYVGAKGHRKPWFEVFAKVAPQTCIIVEGEINALSLSGLFPQWDIISPGGASNFFDSQMKERYTIFGDYTRVIVIVDGDQAGTEAAIKFKNLIRPLVLDITIHLMGKGLDCNEILVKYGKEELKDRIMGMSGGV